MCLLAWRRHLALGHIGQEDSMAPKQIIDVVEQKRLDQAREAGIPWKKWGPYF